MTYKKFTVATLLFVLILVVGALPRAIELLNHNYLFGFDQGLFFQAVKQIVVNHKPALIGSEVGGQGGFFQGPGWYYLLSIPFFLTGGDPFGAMVLMFLLGLGTMFSSYFLFRQTHGTAPALMITFLIALSPAIISQSRFIWPPFPISFLVVWFLYFLFRLLSGHERALIGLGFTISLLFHFEVAVAATLGATLVPILLLLMVRRELRLKTVIAAAVVFFMPLLPLIIFDFRHNFIISHGLYKLIFQGGKPPHEVTQYYAFAMFKNHWEVFLFSFLQTIRWADVLWKILIVGIAGTLGVYLRDKKNTLPEKVFLLYLVLAPVALYGMFMTYMWPMWGWWIIELPIFYCVLLGIVLTYLWRRIPLIRIVIMVLMLLFVFSFTKDVKFFYTVDLGDFGGVHKIKGKTEAIDVIYQDAKGEPFGLFVFTPPIYTYAYDYLVWWHGTRTYGYLPTQNKEGIFYLLIEPDPNKLWTYDGWLRTVIKTGTILKSWNLPSGFIIQKRTGMPGI